MAERAVIFDIDGTLVDTNWFHTVSWWRVFQKTGEPIPMSRIHPLIGMGSDQLVEELLGEERPELKDRHGDEYEPFMDEIVAFPKAGDLLRAVHTRGAKVLLATSSQQAHLKPMLAAVDADDAIDDIVHADDVDQSKPEPDIFQAALDKLGGDAEPARPDDAIVIGDTKWDIEAAERTGLKTICVLTGGNTREELETAGAVAIYGDVAELLASLDDDDSPLARHLGRG
jgi:HAD superfamily hydrolase (TIGR01509 family)